MDPVLTIILVAAVLFIILLLVVALKISKDTSNNINYEEVIEEKQNEIDTLERRLKETENNNHRTIDGLVGLFSYTREEAMDCTDTIIKSYTVSNKNRNILIRALASFVIFHSNSFNLKDLKANKKSIRENIDIVGGYITGMGEPGKYNASEIAEAMYTLIIYKKK